MKELSRFDMMEAVENRVLELMGKFESKFGNSCKYNCDVPSDILFSKRGTTAGVSSFDYTAGYGHLNFNPIIMKDNWEEFDQTVIHEVAHYCVSLLKGYISSGRRRVIHGSDWKSMMRFLGGETRRCHSYNVRQSTRRTQRRWEYKCVCSTHMISTRMHNSIRRGQTRSCVDCSTRIHYVEG